MWAQADLTNRGIIDACKAAKIKLFFTDYDAYVLAPEIMVTSVLMNVTKAMDKVVSDILAGQWKGGYCWTPGLKEGTVDLAPYHNFDSIIPQSVKDTIETMKQDIISGKLVPPLTFEKTTP